MRVKYKQRHTHTHPHCVSVTQAIISFRLRWHLISVAGPNWSPLTCLTVYQWRIIPESTVEGKTHSANPLNVQTRWSESNNSEWRTQNSFNGITSNSVLPQSFNALLGTLTHKSLQEEIRNQYMLHRGLSEEAGRDRPQRQMQAETYR